VARKFLAELMDHRELRGLLSDEHFSVDGTQVAAFIPTLASDRPRQFSRFGCSTASPGALFTGSSRKNASRSALNRPGSERKKHAIAKNLPV
jgi:hypothetical protein